jgi:glucose-fructose oxidoreductase
MAKRTNRKQARSNRPIRYAVIGLGHIAQTAVLPAFEHAKRNSALVALVSSEAKKLKQLGRRYDVEHLYGYDEVDQLFASGAIDAVYIALPNHLHKEYAIKAASAGLHILCEKPMAVTARECEQMRAAVMRAKVKLMIAYRLHYERATLEALEHFRRGKLGELRYFSSDFSMQVADDNIRLNPPEKGGGPLYDIGVYCINAARYCFSADPLEVWATAARSSDRRFRRIAETISGVMRFKGERLATFTCSFGAADRGTFSVVGTRGSLTMDPAYEYAEGLGYEVKVEGRSRTKTFSKSDQFASELLYFSDCIHANRDPEPSAAEGLADVRIIEAMRRSIATGKWVKLASVQRKRRPTLKQEIRRPAIKSEPKLVNAQAASQ